MSSNGWIGVDLDGTLAHYDGWKGADNIGAPIPAMVERVKGWLAEGKTVKIFTARVYCPPEPTHPSSIVAESISVQAQEQILQDYAEWHKRWLEVYTVVRPILRDWLLQHIGKNLDVTCTKDYGMIELWDDRAVRVVPNTGNPCCHAHTN
jgi:hypothetical protein